MSFSLKFCHFGGIDFLILSPFIEFGKTHIAIIHKLPNYFVILYDIFTGLSCIPWASQKRYNHMLNCVSRYCSNTYFVLSDVLINVTWILCASQKRFIQCSIVYLQVVKLLFHFKWQFYRCNNISFANKKRYDEMFNCFSNNF